MTFQAPTAFSNTVAISSETWLSAKSSLLPAWASFRHSSPPALKKKKFWSGERVRSISTVVPRMKDKTNATDLHPITSIRSLLHFGGTSTRKALIGKSANYSSLILCSTNPFGPIRPSALQSARPFSTFPAFKSLLHDRVLLPKFSLGIQRRKIGTGSVSQNILAHMEQTANNNPTSATAQNAFYSSLLRADMPAIVAERYQSGRFATNAAVDATYQRALEKIGQMQAGTSLGSGALAQAQNKLTNEQIQAVAQAIAASSQEGTIAAARPKNGAIGTGAKDSPLYVVVGESWVSAIFKWVKFIMYFVFFGWLISMVLGLAVDISGIFRKLPGASQNNEAQPQHQTVRFSDVHGCEEAKDELQELVEFLKAPEKFSNLGGKLPKGVLLVGPPGTGKTLLARAVAGESGVPFFFMSGAEFDEIYVGVGAKRVRELFSNARAKAPAIIFIDELDAIGSKRNEKDPSYVKQSLNQLLTELDGFSQETGIVIIAATNFPKLLDKALTRPGRFDRKVIVPLPDVRGRLQILKHYLTRVRVAPGVDPVNIARGTTGFSGADLENLVNQAAVRASRTKAKQVEPQHLDWARDRIMMGAERRSLVVPEKERLMTAYHEGGHALIAILNPNSTPLYKVTIMPRGEALGITSLLPEIDILSRDKKQMLAEIEVSMGGKVAEELVYGPDSISAGCSADISNATRTAHAMVTQFGMSETLGNVDLYYLYEHLSSETKQKIEEEVRHILDESYARVRVVLTERRKELDLLAEALTKYEVLDADEVRRVIKGEKLPKLTSDPNRPIKQSGLKAPTGLGELPPSGLGGPPGLSGVPHPPPPAPPLGDKVPGLEQTPQ